MAPTYERRGAGVTHEWIVGQMTTPAPVVITERPFPALFRTLLGDLPDNGLGTTVVRRDFAEEVVRRWWHLTRAQFRDLRRRAQLAARARRRRRL